MASARSHDDSTINSIVGAGTFVRGHVELNGLMRIDGDFSGSIKTGGRVIVGHGGRADCAIEAGTVVVGGLFRGEINATEKVVLLSSSVVLATIRTPRLIAEGGVLFSGRLLVSNEPLPESTTDAAKRKSLLMETVARREVAREEHRDEAGEPVGAVQGGGSRWNE